MTAEDATDLFSELEEDQRGASPTCSVGDLLGSMTDEERAPWDAALANPAYTATSIYRAFKRRDLTIGEQPVMRHARAMRAGNGGCLCPRR